MVTTPALFTVATLLLPDVHVTALLDASVGVMSAVSFIFFPAAIFFEIPDSLIFDTLIFSPSSACVPVLPPEPELPGVSVPSELTAPA